MKLFFYIALLFYFTSIFLYSEDIPEVGYWTGSIHLIQTETYYSDIPAPTEKKITYEWTMNVRWKELEGGHEVKTLQDGSIKLTGLFRTFIDDGSSWTGNVYGNGSMNGPCNDFGIDIEGSKHQSYHQKMSMIYSSEPQVGNTTIDSGWIYYSLSENDPLGLPNGTYAFRSPGSQASSAHGFKNLEKETIAYIKDLTCLCCNETWQFKHGDPSMGTMFMKKPLIYFVGADSGVGVIHHDNKSANVAPFNGAINKPYRYYNTNEITPGTIYDPQSPRNLIDGKMKGSFVINYPAQKNSWSLNQKVEWDIQKIEKIDAFLTPPIEKWRPRPTDADEYEEIEITAYIDQNENKEGKFKFTLYEVSQEKNDSLNTQTNSSNEYDNFDLIFTPNQEDFTMMEKNDTNDGWSIETNELTTEATIKIKPLDGGAWGKLKAEVNVNGIWYLCTLKDKGATYTTLPKDDNENHIADFWEDQYQIKNQHAESDQDNFPDGLDMGDGFSNYEEYRGFHTKEEGWISTDPTIKDIFIHDEIGEGVQIFYASGLDIHLITEDQYNGNDSRIVNYNREYASSRPDKGQKGIWLTKGPVDGAYGHVEPKVGCPNDIQKITIDIDDIEAHNNNMYHEFERFNRMYVEEYGEDVTVDQFIIPIDWVIAHELGHSVNLHHPGPLYPQNDCNGKEQSLVGLWGGVSSGHTSNIMRYPHLKYYIKNEACHVYPHYDIPGNSFVTTLEATGLNAGEERVDLLGNSLPIAGNASYKETLATNMSLLTSTPTPENLSNE